MHFGPAGIAGHRRRGDTIVLSFLNPHGALTPPVFTVTGTTKEFLSTHYYGIHLSPSLPFKLFLQIYAIVGCSWLILSCTSQPAVASPLLLKITIKKPQKYAVPKGLQVQRGGSARRKATAQGKAALQHASNAIDLRLNELVGKYVITLSYTRQGQF